MNKELLKYLPDPNVVKGGMAEVVEIVQREAPWVVEEIIRWNITWTFISYIGV